jgi:hypothetical protein
MPKHHAARNSQNCLILRAAPPLFLKSASLDRGIRHQVSLDVRDISPYLAEFPLRKSTVWQIDIHE